MEGLATLNQALMQGLSYCCWVFGGRSHFNASLLLLYFIKNFRLMNPYLYPDCTEGQFTTWLNAREWLRHPPVRVPTPPSYRSRLIDD